MYESAHAVLDGIVADAVVGLRGWCAAGGSGGEFQAQLVGAFVVQAVVGGHDANSAVLYALAVYRLALQQEQISRLADGVQMREALIAALLEVSDGPRQGHQDGSESV